MSLKTSLRHIGLGHSISYWYVWHPVNMINLVSRDDSEVLIYTTHRIVNRMTVSHLQLQELRALPQNTANVHALVGVCGTWQA